MNKIIHSNSTEIPISNLNPNLNPNPVINSTENPNPIPNSTPINNEIPPLPNINSNTSEKKSTLILHDDNTEPPLEEDEGKNYDLFLIYDNKEGVKYSNEPLVTLQMFLKQYHNINWLRNHRFIFRLLLPSTHNNTSPENIDSILFYFVEFKSNENYMNIYRKILRITFLYFGTEPKVVNSNIEFEHTKNYEERYKIWGREKYEYDTLTLLFHSLVAVGYQFYSTSLYQLFKQDKDNSIYYIFLGYLLYIGAYLDEWNELYYINI